MKKSRLLIAMLVMLVAASSYAQDSYREAVRQYMKDVDVLADAKTTMSSLKLLFEKNDQVDIDKLSERYLNERLEDDFLDFLVPMYQDQNVSVAELQELSSLLSSPQGKAYSAHHKEWMTEFATEIIMSMYGALEDNGPGEELIMPPVEPNAAIDAAFAAKFKNLMDVSHIVSQFLESMDKRMNEFEPEIDEEMVKDVDKVREINNEAEQKTINWYKENVPIVALNTAYDKLTVEDLDYALMLYSKEYYRKLQDVNLNEEYVKQATNFWSKYIEWMQAQGATISNDPNVLMLLLKNVYGEEVGDAFNFDSEYIDQMDLGDRKSN